MLLLFLFTILWIHVVSAPGIALETAAYYTEIIGGASFQAIDGEESLKYWLQDTTTKSLFPDSESSFPVGKLCVTEYYAESIPCHRGVAKDGKKCYPAHLSPGNYI